MASREARKSNSRQPPVMTQLIDAIVTILMILSFTSFLYYFLLAIASRRAFHGFT